MSCVYTRSYRGLIQTVNVWESNFVYSAYKHENYTIVYEILAEVVFCSALPLCENGSTCTYIALP